MNMKIRMIVAAGIVALGIFSFLFALRGPSFDYDPISPGMDTYMTMGHIDQARKLYEAFEGHIPAGNSAEIVATLRGQNPRNFDYLQRDGKVVNSDNEVLDHWNTPLDISFVDEQLKIVSAGKDRVFETPDDIWYEQGYTASRPKWNQNYRPR